MSDYQEQEERETWDAVASQVPETWDTESLQRDFVVEGFLAPYVVVTRKSDGQRGTLTFTHRPRVYRDFRADT
jgi:hypothetical protein